MAEKAHYFYDDFTFFDGSKWWVTNPITGVVSAGQMQLVPTDGYNYVNSAEKWDLVNSHIELKLIQNANAGLGSISNSIIARINANNSVEFDIRGGGVGATITCRETVLGVSDEFSFLYDPVIHIWFRIRENLGTIFWETSINGLSWTLRWSKETALSLVSVDIRFMSSFWAAETDPGMAIIDSFNLSQGIPARAKTGTIVDNFNLATSQWEWGDSENQVVNNQLHMLSTDTNYSPLYADGTYDFTDSHFGLELVQNNPIGNGTFVNDISVGPDLDNCVYVRFGGSGSWISFTERVGGADTSGGSVQLNPVKHRFFRIRESGGTVYWDTSIDGKYWVNHWSKATVLDLTESRVRIYCAPYGTENPATVIWDNVNIFGGNTIGPEIIYPLELFKDSFDEDSPVWYHSENIVIQNSALTCHPTEIYEYTVSNDSWSLIGSYCLWNLKQNALQGTGNGGEGSITTELTLTADNSDSVKFIIYGGSAGKIYCRSTINDVHTEFDFVYNSNSDKWFRIRESGGKIYWETSSNCITWKAHRSDTIAIDFSSVKPGVNIGFWDSENEDGNSGTVILDSFNLPDLSLTGSIGWMRNNSLSCGAIKTGTVQPRQYFDLADWLWNPIPDNPVLDPDSENIAYWLHRPDITPVPQHTNGVVRYANALVHPNQIDDDTQRYHVHLDWVEVYNEYGDLLSDPFFGYQGSIPIPLGTQVPPGSDAHLSIADPVTKKVFSLWQARYDVGTGTWRAAYGGIADLHGDGREYAGSSTATNISRYACVPRLNELQAGEIPHALFCATNIAKQGGLNSKGNWQNFRYPAQKSDGQNLANAGYPVEEGSRLQLDPNIDLVAIPNISPIELAVGRCWQRYGCYVGDQGGNTWPPTFGAGGAGELWQGQVWPKYPFPEPRSTWVWPSGDPFPEVEPPLIYKQMGFEWDYFAFTKIPWAGNIRVLKRWDGTA